MFSIDQHGMSIDGIQENMFASAEVAVRKTNIRLYTIDKFLNNLF